jgi:hypothetical protein
LLLPGVGWAAMVVMLLFMHWAISSIMVAFIHQNGKNSYAQIFFASKAIAPKALRSLRLWCE